MYLSGRKKIPVPEVRRPRTPGRELVVRGAREHNLRDIDVRFPLGLFVAVTGVSGSGKSTVVNDILYASLAKQIYNARTVPGRHKRIEGMDEVDKVIHVDQSPIGRTPRSNPATYTGVFDHVRKLFASTAEAKVRGYQQGRFSFNVKGGRCEACHGDGTIKIEMNFLPDVYVPCEVCHGARYNRETLEVHYKGKTIAEVLDMPIEEAVDFFAAIPAIARHMTTLVEVGLGYVRLGQPAPTLSGGEAQRVKLSSELQKRSTGRTVYVLDEPTTGLHFEDIRKLLLVLGRLVDQGNTRAGHRAQPGRHQDRRLAHRHGPRGRQPRRHGRRGGHPGGGGRAPGQLHRPVPRTPAGRPPREAAAQAAAPGRQGRARSRGQGRGCAEDQPPGGRLTREAHQKLRSVSGARTRPGSRVKLQPSSCTSPSTRPHGPGRMMSATDQNPSPRQAGRPSGQDSFESSDAPARPTGVSRRVVLSGVTLGGLAVPLLAACGASDDDGGDSSSGSGGSSGSSGSGGTVSVAAADVPVGGGAVLSDDKVVVTQPTKGEFKAFSAVCTHQGCIVAAVKDGEIVCNCHGSHFSITDGSPVSGPAKQPLATKKATAKGSEVTVT